LASLPRRHAWDIWTAVFYAASRKFAILSRRTVVSGLLYGGAIYPYMNFIVLLLSGVPHPQSPVTIGSRINGVLSLLFFIGLPISQLLGIGSGHSLLGPAGIIDPGYNVAFPDIDRAADATF
jgi:hypothetical protein